MASKIMNTKIYKRSMTNEKKLLQMDLTHYSELSSSSFLHVSINTNSSFIWAMPLQRETTRHVITYLWTYFVIMRTPNSIKTDTGPTCISK